jgi:hypothetical protein
MEEASSRELLHEVDEEFSEPHLFRPRRQAMKEFGLISRRILWSKMQVSGLPTVADGDGSLLRDQRLYGVENAPTTQ